MPQATIGHFSVFRQLIAVVLISFLLYFGKTLFIPMFYGLFIAIVLYPVCKKLEQHHWPRSLAITLGLLVVIILFGALVAILVFQVRALQRDLPELLERLKPSIAQLQDWLEKNLHIGQVTQNTLFQNLSGSFQGNAGNFLKVAIAGIIGAFFTLFLIPVYAALFLYNRAIFVNFLSSVVGKSYQDQLHEILHDTIHTYFHFIKGMLFVYLIVGILNSLGLLALGVPHAILFGMVTAIMTIIPYFGIIISALLPITIVWITKESIWYPIGVVGVFVFVQYLEANLIFPKVVASQLNVSTWATLVAIIAGGILWGVSGMILFIPFVGILKIVSEHVDDWKPLKILLSR